MSDFWLCFVCFMLGSLFGGSAVFYFANKVIEELRSK